MSISKSKATKILITFWGIVIIGMASVFTLFLLIANGFLGDMPSFEELENPKSNLATQILSEDGKLLGTFAIENRTYCNFEDLSPNIVNALIATEDVRFYDHSGIDPRGLMRVFFRTVLMGDRHSGGGSTISQQLAKLLFHDSAGSIWERSLQKLNEWVIAVKLERSYTKNEILTMYLNKVGFIYDAYGIHSAAQTFFNTSTDSIKIEEAAVIIGMLKNPALFNPVRRPELTEDRRNVVLSQMKKAQFITQAKYDSLRQIPLKLKFKRNDHKEGVAPYLRENLRLTLNAPKPDRSRYPSYLMDKFIKDSIEWATNPVYGFTNKNLKADGTKYNIYRDGIKIYTTVNYNMQVYAEKAVKDHLSQDLQPAFAAEKKGRPTAPFTADLSEKQYDQIMNKAIRQSERYRIMKKAGHDEESIMKAFNTKTDMEIFTWSGDRDTIMTPIDSIKHFKSFLRASLYSLDPRTGYVKAYVGGPNFKYFMYDMATQGKRQVGSTIKPFIYTLAMSNGFTPCYQVPNIPTTFYLASGDTWTPRNAGSARAGEMVTLKWGLANSNNNITAWVMKQFKNPKWDAAPNMIRNLGINSPMPYVPSLCLGVVDMHLSEMVGAYGTFANKGVHIDPILVTRIEDRYGNNIGQFAPNKKEVISEETAFLMLNLLQGVSQGGTATRLRYKYQFTGEIGAKTGTTQNQSDGWFMGVTPNLVTGIWVGGEDRDVHFDGISLGQGANMALPIWALYMQQVYDDEALNITQEDEFEEPLNFNTNLNCDELNGSQNNDPSEDDSYSNGDESEFL
ncbi:transglycosylase domain-containing protein [Saccharicrinis aurantiacus]|uniref:transglycosylase domain-containing protein n=1 Tax=Saccharicrinis aurantiacus TaxID=1849719 RepID=UPI002490CCAB|nr:transglycosylase domain-containing protein [Saccharicrinis aurantiacus]